ASPVYQIVYKYISICLTVVWVRYRFVFSGVKFIQQQVNLAHICLATSYSLYLIIHISGQCIYLIILVKVRFGKASGLLSADVYTLLQANTLRVLMRCRAYMI